MNNINIIYILGSKFPTSKAYGVTTRETLKEILKKSYNVKLFCLKSNYYDDDFVGLTRIINYLKTGKMISHIISIGERNNKRINQILWRIGITLVVVNNIKFIEKSSPSIVWVRDPVIAYICSLKIPNTKIVCEIHSTSSKYIYKFIKHKKQIHLFPINLDNQLRLHNLLPKRESQIANMAINEENMANFKQVEKFVNHIQSTNNNITVGYVGKFSPQGYSKGIEDLILLASFFQTTSKPFKVIIAGYLENELVYFQKMKQKLKISDQYLNFMPHMKHSEALYQMKNMDVLILPMPENSKYNGMPLKLLEYLASGRITIIANTKLIRQYFREDFQPYYYQSGEVTNLYLAIIHAINDKQLKRQILLGLIYASKYTWKERTEKILNLLST